MEVLQNNDKEKGDGRGGDDPKRQREGNPGDGGKRKTNHPDVGRQGAGDDGKGIPVTDRPSRNPEPDENEPPKNMLVEVDKELVVQNCRGNGL